MSESKVNPPIRVLAPEVTEEAEVIPRQEFDLKLNTEQRGQMTLRMFDRINVDDVFLHLVRREVFRVTTGQDQGIDVARLFKDFLIKERFTAGQN